MGSMKEICQKLDETLDEFFTVQQNLLTEQFQLDQRLKDAFFLMSKARYTMGVKSVSSLQYNESDLVEADINVCVEGNNSFTPVCKTEQSSQDKENSIRKRDVLRENTPQSSSDTQSTQSSNDTQSTGTTSKGNKKSKKDPIHWFGILVPQSLKQCQAQFRKVPDIICTIVGLKAQYVECLKRYHDLLDQKQMLMNETFEKLEIES